MASPATIHLVRTPPIAHSSRWSLDGIRTALANLMQGDFSSAAMLTEAMLGDDRILHCYQQIALEVTGRDLRFDASSGSDGRSSKSWSKTVEGFYTTKTMTQTATWEIVKWSEFLGVCVGQTTTLVDGSRGSRRWIPVVNVLPPHFLRFDERKNEWRYQTETGLVPVTPGVNGWFLYLPRGARGFVEGAVRALAHPWIARSFGRKDLSRWSELYGNGMIKAKHPKDARDPVVRKWLEGVRNLGREPVVKIPDGYDVQMINATNAQANGFEILIGHCDRAITLVLQGQILTSETAPNGNRSLGDQHRATANARTIGRVRLLEQWERESVLKPASEWNQGDAEAAPYPVRDLDPPEDEKKSAEALGAFAEAVGKCIEIGIPIDLETLAEQYGVPLLDAVDLSTRLLCKLSPDNAKVIRVDEWRERLGLEPLGGELGEKFVSESGAAPKPSPSAGDDGNGGDPPAPGDDPGEEGGEEKEPSPEGKESSDDPEKTDDDPELGAAEVERRRMDRT